MQLFSGMGDAFINKALNNTIADTLQENFVRYFGSRPSKSEVNSWMNSLRNLSFSLADSSLRRVGVIVEYRLPMSNKRLDAMITGIGSDSRERAVIVELKQWQSAYKCGVQDCVSFEHGPSGRTMLHPSSQAGSYAEYLKGSHTAFYNDSGGSFVDLEACSFLHDANSRNCGDLLDEEYRHLIDAYPLFTGDMREEFGDFLSGNVGKDSGEGVLQKILHSKYMPSRKLLEHVADIIEGNPVFTLLDEQLITFNEVLTRAKRLGRNNSKAVILVRGAPGTGKSVIAVRLLAELAKMGRNVVHCTGSKAFTTNLRAQVDRRSSAVFKYFNNFSQEVPDTIDVLIADEAHRIRETSNTRFTRSEMKSNKSQVLELIDAAKVSVFLLDDNQVVRPGEVGTPQLIRNAALERGIEISEMELQGQFRCSGSESYLRWLDFVFDLGGDPDLSWKDDYEFRIFDSPIDMEKEIRRKFGEGNTARLVAGFCWPWSEPARDGSLVEDVIIGNWKRPWNRKERGSEPPTRHPYKIWATEDEGLDQIGCIYSAQGFEFDYCGVIVGNDLTWNDRQGMWMGEKTNSCDNVVKRSKNLVRHLANTYRVLFSRGMKGTYVYFVDSATKRRFQALLSREGRYA